ncbi:nuclear transcription factor Y subunit C-2-like isoform X2 [Phalaenopsis equestris]|uniref:nuclear transcription factor Y subunit C-2-like isoform X2 n=1 Tax=Phalaenopsis equestris TaxID=78828 RepID=UPI0009E376C1|nr:nuclear transcription factor Y subunit C-2-like isoform X2 [Phalaenopsis equestris]
MLRKFNAIGNNKTSKLLLEENGTEQEQQTAMDSLQLPLVTNRPPTNLIIGTNPQLQTNALPKQFPYHFPPPYQIPPQVQQPQLAQHDLRHQSFWVNLIQDINIGKNIKNHSLPLARIKKIMKSDEDVKMIAAEVDREKRKTLQRGDISLEIAKHQAFDFLVDIVPEKKVAESGAAASTSMTISGDEQLNQSISCFHDPSMLDSLMMDFRNSETVPHCSISTQQHQHSNASENGESAAPNLSP